MKRFLLLLLIPITSWGHIGSPNVYFEGRIGPSLARVIIRPPDVIPGLADIDVRILEGTATRITALPIFWDAGRGGAPPPDEAKPVKGEPNLYHTRLWLMSAGAYSVEVSVQSEQGNGTVMVPVNSVAMTRKAMPSWFGGMLAVLGTLLFLSAIKLVGAAFGESIVEPGREITRGVRIRTWLSMLAGALVFGALLFLGKAWWDLSDSNYRNKRLYKPATISASVRTEKDDSILRLTVEERRRRDWKPLISDHGKLMHLFMVREPDQDVFAHLHPIQRTPGVFDVILPPLPVGGYKLYADVTHEDGFSQTLTTTAQIPASTFVPSVSARPSSVRDVICSSISPTNLRTNGVLIVDPDDSWHVSMPEIKAPNPSALTSALANGFTMIWEKGGSMTANQQSLLRFQLRSPNGQPAPIEPYMGMLGHAVIRRDDGSVFAHLHPSGTFSMASQNFFAGNAMEEKPHVPPIAFKDAVSFPYEFPQAGHYRIWVQLKSSGRIFTGVFDDAVEVGKR